MLRKTIKAVNLYSIADQPILKRLKNEFMHSLKNSCNFSQLKSQQNKNKKQYKFNVLTEKELYDNIPNISNVFAKIDPSKGLGITAKINGIFLEQIAPIALKRGISLACKDENNKMVGCTLMFDTYDEKYIDESKIDKKIWSPLFRLLQAVSQQFYLNNKITEKQGIYAHSFMTSVFQQYQNLGISTLIYKKQHQHCKNLGYKYLIRQTTNPKARHNLLKLGTYKEIKYLAFKDFVFNGQKLLKHADDGVAFLVNDMTSQQQ